MRFILPFLASFALVAVASPVPSVSQLEVRQSTDAITKATENTQTFNAELKRIIGEIKADPIFQLHPGDYNFPADFQSSLTAALDGIAALGTITTPADLPDYAAVHYGPLVNALGEVVFYTFIDFKLLSQRIVNDPEYTAFTQAVDLGTWEYVKAVNAQFQGVACKLASTFGLDNPLGQTLKVVSDQLFYLLLDNIKPGQC